MQARWDRRSAEFTCLPPFGAVSAVDDDAWYGTEAADPEQRCHGPAGYDGESCSGSPHVAQDLVDACQRTRIVRVW